MNASFRQLGAQLLEIWRHLGLNQKVSVIIASAALIGALAGLALWSSRAEYSLLYGRLAESEGARVISELDNAKIPYRTGAGGTSIYVPAEKVHSVRMQLAGRGIPKGDGVGFEIFDKPNFGISDFVQRANYLRAVQGELVRTISQMDEIDSARVMIVVPENRLLLANNQHPTASVFVKVRGSSQLPSESVSSIRFLVANSVEGLKPNFVTVVDNRGHVLSETQEEDSILGLTTSQLGARRNLEHYLSKKTEGMLEQVLGPGQAIVRVSADINLDTVTRTEERFDPDGQVIRTETRNEEDNNTSQATAGEAVGLASNTASTNAPAQRGPVSSMMNKRTVGTTEYEISKTTSNVFHTAGGIRRLTAAVTIASRYEGTGAERKLVSRPPEEIEKLKRIVESSLGNDSTRGDLITLEEIPFNVQFAEEITTELNKESQREFYWTLARNVGYPLMALAVLFFMVRLLKRTPVEHIPIGVPLGHLASNGNGNGNGNGHKREWHPEVPHEVVTVDTLNQLVRENPGNVTHAIRNWLGRSSDTNT